MEEVGAKQVDIIEKLEKLDKVEQNLHTTDSNLLEAVILVEQCLQHWAAKPWVELPGDGL